MSGTLKNDRQDGKVRLELLPVGPLRELARVMGYGANKYGEHNWREGLEWSRYYGAAQRHLFAWLEGEEIDPESGLPHLAHATTNLLYLLEFSRTGRGVDDRYVEPTEASDSQEVVRSVPGPIGNVVGAKGADKNTNSNS